MVQYSYDAGTKKYISSTGEIMGGGQAYKTADGKWSLEDPNKATSVSKLNTKKPDLNSMSGSVAQNNSRNSQVGTGSVASMPEQQTTPQVKQYSMDEATANKLAKSRNSLSYEEQQKKLNNISGLKDALAQRGIASKTQPTTTTTNTTTTQPTTQPTSTKTTTPKTPKQEQWDYQDNSQSRMNEIANNLNGYRQTMPQLFDDGTAFYNFFIKDKGRSQDQIDFLWDYFNRVQKYGKYDNLSPDALGTGIANGDIPEDYLNTLKTTDPQKYQEVMSAKQNREDTIKNESFLNDAATMAGIEGWESEPSSIQYGKWNGIWMDEDNNGIDDRREHYASEEEQGYQKQIADLNAANLEIDNIVKHAYDDLVERYPGATKATLMAMAQDRNSDLLREKENNLVELTRLQGYVSYMQSERQEMNQAGADSIAQLQKNLGMYYQYSPEGLSELAQAQYAATNITLDQADSGNETQKQMALQSVLDDYYAKYGSIIQRSEQQVINDIIAYAKKNGVGLAEAFQKNFVEPLQSKTAYKNIQRELETAGLSEGISWTKIGQDADGNDIYGFVDTTNMSVTPFGASEGGKSYTSEGVSKDRDTRKSFMSDIADQYGDIDSMANAIAGNMNGLGDGNLECGVYVNDYIYGVTGEQGKFGNDVSQKESICDNKDKSGVKVGDAIVFNWSKNEPQWVRNSQDRESLLKYGHVGFVTGIDDQGNVTMSHTVGGNVTSTTFNLYGNNDYANNFAGSQTVTPKKTTAGGGKGYSTLENVQTNKNNKVAENEAFSFAKRAWKADEEIREFEKKYEGAWDSLLMKFGDWSARTVGGSAKSQEQKKYEALRNEFVNAALRRESGAAIGQTEFSDDEKGAIQRYFPQPGDSAEVIALKQKLRENYIETMFSVAGKSSDGTSFVDLYQKNAIHNYANDDSEGGFTEYDWMA